MSLLSPPWHCLVLHRQKKVLLHPARTLPLRTKHAREGKRESLTNRLLGRKQGDRPHQRTVALKKRPGESNAVIVRILMVLITSISALTRMVLTPLYWRCLPLVPTTQILVSSLREGSRGGLTGGYNDHGCHKHGPRFCPKLRGSQHAQGFYGKSGLG
ncbi:hypothetical protein Adt_31084 [Abeliophyllum distichum]|uniref:Uncharacterized protein n=1 Tax=Abeliophyllum distichum TaxID=126358 RepID=A0ABD1RD85_9LAMI